MFENPTTAHNTTEKERIREIETETIKSLYSPFLLDTLNRWGSKEDAEKLAGERLDIKLVPPTDVDWKNLQERGVRGRGGEVVFNPETLSIDWENTPVQKFKAIELKEMEGKSVAEVAKYVVTTYGDTHYIPGIEYLNFIVQNPEKASPLLLLEDGNTYYFFGSTIATFENVLIPGVDCHPSEYTDSPKFRRAAIRPNDTWVANTRVFLLEK
ncbi:MAG: hypothetical protein M0P64_03175 [Candidatus Pacebacteria bacterium]|nr:hypothetical protein [Candidatus Paceibacterota bacterium]